MSKHTPGPWKLDFQYGNGDKYSEIVPKNYKTSELHEAIAIIPHDDVSEDSEPQMLANARLIAAAPELLEALLEAEDYIDRYCEGFVGEADLLQKIADVLAKVRP